MAYGARYTSYVKGVSNQNYQFTIYEKDYAGSVVDELPTAQQPFSQEYNTADDDIFQPIVTTSFTLNVDITDVTFTLPDFTNTDDFKYYGVLFSGSNILFKGWLLTDQIQLPFTTGRKFIQYKFIDGLTMLKDIKYVPTVDHPNVMVNLRSLLSNAFDAIIYPEIGITAANGWNLGIICNIFADTMTTKASGATNEPLVQSFISQRSLQNNDGTYIDYYTIIERISKSFAAQIFQAEGTWWFGSIVDLARTTCDVVYLTSAGVVSSGTKTAGYTLAPYTNGTQDLYYVNNGQTKTVKKGFANFNVNYNFDYRNIIPNNLFTDLTAGSPDYWTVTKLGGAGTITSSMTTIKQYDALRVLQTGAITGGYVTPALDSAGVSPVLDEVFTNVKFRLSFTYQTNNINPTKPLGYIMLFVNRNVGPSNVESYYLDNNLQWVKASNTAIPWAFGNIPYNLSPNITLDNNEAQDYTLDTPYLPEFATGGSPLYDTGIVYFGIGFDSTNFDTDWKVTNFKLEAITSDESLNINYAATGSKYTKDIDLEIGGENKGSYSANPSFNGAIVSNSGSNARKIYGAWNYYYSIPGSSQFISLLHFVGECQANNLSPIAITLDGEMQGVYIRRNGASTLTPFSYLCHIVVKDSASAPYSVNGTKYRPSRLNIDYKADIISATLCPVVALTNRTTLTKTEFYKLRES